MVVQLDDAKIQVTLDTENIERELKKTDKRRGEKEKTKRTKEVQKVVQKEAGVAGTQGTKGGKGKKMVSLRSRLKKGAAFTGGAIGVATILERYGPEVARQLSSLVVENMAKGGLFGHLQKLMKGAWGIDLKKELKVALDDGMKPFWEKLTEVTAFVDEAKAGIQSIQETAEWAKNAALLGRSPGYSKISNVFDETQELRFSELRQSRFIKREQTEAVMVNVFAKGGGSLMRYFGMQ